MVLVRRRSPNPQKYYISKINLSNFRLIDEIEFEPARIINVIAGKNGTAKSTILGMIAQGYSFNPFLLKNITKKTYEDTLTKDEKTEEDIQMITDYNNLLSYTNKNFESKVNEHFNLSEQDVLHENHATITMSSSHAADIKFRIESNDYSGTGRKNPRLVTRRLTNTTSEDGKDISSSNLRFPLLYLGLERVNPIVLSGKLSSTELGLSREDEQEIFTLYQSILLKTYHTRSVGITNNRNKNTLAFIPEDRSLEMISSGEDNLGQILLSLYSFKKLKENHAGYEGGILLIDEIDATLYQAAQNKLLDVIYEKAREFGVQVFLTTHSLSLIEHVMDYKFRSRYHEGAVEIFQMGIDIDQKLNIKIVDNIQALYNEFFVSIGERRKEEKINIYFEDAEAIDLFNSLIDSKVKKYLKIDSKFTIGSKELIKFHNLKISEFFENSIVCLDADQKLQKGFTNFFTLPNVDDMPPEKFVFSILNDPISSYWRQTKDYNHAMFMNNRYYQTISTILAGRYGSEDDFHGGPYNVSGGEFEGISPREVWKTWYKSEKTHFKGNNNPVKYWKTNHQQEQPFTDFLKSFTSAFNYVARNKGIDVQLKIDNNNIVIE